MRTQKCFYGGEIILVGPYHSSKSMNSGGAFGYKPNHKFD